MIAMQYVYISGTDISQNTHPWQPYSEHWNEIEIEMELECKMN